MKVVLTAKAVVELREIGDWIAQDSPRRTESFADELDACCAALAKLPRRWPLIPRYERYEIRKRAYYDYLICYRIDADAITVIRVLHGARDYEAVLFPDGYGATPPPGRPGARPGPRRSGD